MFSGEQSGETIWRMISEMAHTADNRLPFETHEKCLARGFYFVVFFHAGSEKKANPLLFYKAFLLN